MKTKLLVGLTILIGMIACDKDPNNPGQETGNPDYFPLTTGSYWVYNTYEIDSAGNQKIESENDTIFIIGDSIIHGLEYKVFYGKKLGIDPDSYKTESFFRDSSGYIIDETGRIIFSLSNFTDTLYITYPITNDSSLFWYTMMETFPDEISLPAGVFDSVLNCKFYVFEYNPDNKLLRANDYLYAPNVGRILKQYFYLDSYRRKKSYFEDRLIDYYIAP